jgi:hypothetical protein
MKKALLLMTLAAAASTAGCAHQWETVLDGRLYTRTNLHRYPVSITAVNGEYSTITPRRVDAGELRLTIDAPPVAGFHLPVRKEFTFRAEKCVRYWLAAQRASSLSRDFQLVVDHAEPVPGCQPTSGALAQAVIVPADVSQIDPPRAIPLAKRP